MVNIDLSCCHVILPECILLEYNNFKTRHIRGKKTSMSEQSNNKPNNSTPANQGQQRRPHHNNNRRRHPNHNNSNNPNNRDPQKDPQREQQREQQRATSPQQNGQNPNNRRRPQHNNNRPRPQHSNNHQGQNRGTNNTGGFSIERIYEKYLNLLDQHIIARRKYHDMFYRADPNQKIKLEKNFYNTLNDIREFESRLAPDVRDLFEKRNNGLAPDRIYTQNHELSIEGDPVPADLPPAEPHLLQSQIVADYSSDTEESVGTAEDYLKYKNLF